MHLLRHKEHCIEVYAYVSPKNQWSDNKVLLNEESGDLCVPCLESYKKWWASGVSITVEGDVARPDGSTNRKPLTLPQILKAFFTTNWPSDPS
jgi:hypothetical protein